MEKNAQSNFQNSLFRVQEREGAGPASFLQARGPGGAFDVDSAAGGPRPQPARGGANLAPGHLTVMQPCLCSMLPWESLVHIHS